MRFILLFAALLGTSGLSPNALFAQSAPEPANESRRLAGYVRDKASERELAGALVELLNFSPRRVAYTDSSGFFALNGVPLGRYRLLISKDGYQEIIANDVVLSADQAAELAIELEGAVAASADKPSGVTVLPSTSGSTKTSKDQPYSPLSGISTRAFTIEEVTRYAGARFDPALLITNFAGVSSYDDSRNDIVIRGNSPSFLIWQIEELPVENPNHITTIGTAGGAIPILNIFAMGKADFAKGSFSAQYGNTVAGVFDIQLREGNRQRLSGLAQIGSQRAGLLLEGPLRKGRPQRGSFMVAARSSVGNYFLSKYIATDPEHQDLNFKIDFGRRKWGALEFFGLMGRSMIYVPVNGGSFVEQIRYQLFVNQDYRHESWMSMGGLKYTRNLGRSGFWRTVVGTTRHYTRAFWNNYNWLGSTGGAPRIDTSYLIQDDRINLLAHSYLQTGVGKRGLLRAGVVANFARLNLQEFSYFFAEKDTDFKGWRSISRAYAQSRWNLHKNLTLYAGLNAIYCDYSKTHRLALDPRASITWSPAAAHNLSFGYGMNHQTPSLDVQFFNPIVGYDSTGSGIYDYQGRDLRYLRGQHLDLEYNWRAAENWRVKIQAYAQRLDRVFVENDSASLYTAMNAGATFFSYYINELNNSGRGRQWGVEATVEKFFSQGYYGLFSASVFDSKYRGGDGVWRNTIFNNRYIVNVLFGREFRFGNGKRHVLFTDVRFSTKGGRPYRPIDAQATFEQGFQNGNLEPVYNDSLAYLVFTPAFYQVDFKIGVRINSMRRKSSHTIRLDLFNALNTKNVFTYQYSQVFDPSRPPSPGREVPIYQRGFIPDLTYLWQF